MARTELLYQRVTQIFKDDDLLINVKNLVVGSKISEGSSSSVHRGRYDGTPVAVKIMQPPLGSPVGYDLMKKFAREVTLLNQGRHENVVKLIGASVEPTLLIVTELMQGGSLKSYLWDMRPKQRRPDLQQSIRFALDISRALEHLHAGNIIHRDLKPGNLVLAADQKTLKLADFGLAQEGNDIKDMLYETGNIRWTAPELIIKKEETAEQTKTGEQTKIGEQTKTGEQTTGKQTDKQTVEKKEPLAFDRKVDVFSFSIVLWELLTNKTPPSFKPKTSRPSLHELPDSVPEDLVNLLKSCWAEEPTERPEFTAIIKELTDILNALP